MTITLTDWQRRELVRMDKPTDTLESFLIGRAEWLEVVTSEVSPNAFDILLKIDGTYQGSDQADEIAESFRSDLRDIVDKTIERHQPTMTGPIPTPASLEMQETIDRNILAALDGLPYGRAEEDVRAAAFYIFRMTGPTEREIAEWHDAFDFVLHGMVGYTSIESRVVGGRLRFLEPMWADALDEATEAASGGGDGR